MTLSSDLSGQTALVTGASSGLGKRFAQVLAKNGARVALAARRKDRLESLRTEIEDQGGRAAVIELDVTAASQISGAVDAAESELGPVTILVNNAGIGLSNRAEDVTETEYDAVMDTNLKGVFLMAQEVGRRMIERGRGGRIINIASAGAFQPVKGLAVYAAAKAGVAQLTRALALEWARHDINVNAICPGYIETEINAEFFASERGRRFVATFPRRRVGRPEHLDGLLLLLASGDSDFINGSLLLADDALTIGR